jgi:hypothetical protein
VEPIPTDESQAWDSFSILSLVFHITYFGKTMDKLHLPHNLRLHICTIVHCRTNTCFGYGSQNFFIDPESQNEYLNWQIRTICSLLTGI